MDTSTGRSLIQLQKLAYEIIGGRNTWKKTYANFDNLNNKLQTLIMKKLKDEYL